MKTFRPRHVVWDWNGTLFNDTDVCWRICREMVGEQGGNPPSMEEFRRRFCIPVRAFWHDLLGKELPDEKHLLLGEDFHLRYAAVRHECALQDDARIVLAHLREAGIDQSVLSSHPQALLDAAIDLCGIRSYFTALSGHPGEGGGSKIPHGRKHLEALRLVAEETVLIGDTLHDHELAVALGMKSILFAGGAQCPTRFSEVEATVVHSLSELIDLFGIQPGGRASGGTTES